MESCVSQLLVERVKVGTFIYCALPVLELVEVNEIRRELKN